jgi:hypothetical protein
MQICWDYKMIGKVTAWKMAEEERLAYIKKHPIRPTKKPTGSTFGETMGCSKNWSREKSK